MDAVKLRVWSFHRQGFGQNFTSIDETLKRVVAVYSTNPSGPLSLRARMNPDISPNIYEAELQKVVLRNNGMRGSVYLMLSEDFPVIRAAGLAPFYDEEWNKRYSEKGRFVDPKIQEQVEKKLNILEHKPLDIKEFRTMFDVPDEMAKLLVNKLCWQGKMLRVGTESKSGKGLLYTGTKQWLGEKLNLMNGGDAIKQIALRYFSAFGPASLKDFAWWLALPQKKVKEAVQQKELIEIEEGYFLNEHLVDEWKQFEAQFPAELRFLPQWDSYTMGYAPEGRSRFVKDEHLAKLYGKIGATGGNAVPCIMHQGEIIASWKSQKKGNKLNLEVQPFEKLKAVRIKQIEEEIGEIASFLDSNLGSITIKQ